MPQPSATPTARTPVPAARTSGSKPSPTSAQANGRPRGAKAGTVREVFLSPRVVDREAFNDFAASLRALIADAQTHANGLEAATAAAREAQTTATEIANRHQARFDAAARVLASIDEHAAQAERLLGASRDAANTLDAIRTDSATLIDNHTRAVRERLDQVLAHAERRMAEFEEAAQARAAAFERTLAERIEAGLKRIDEHARQTSGSLADAAQRVIAEVGTSGQASADEVRSAAEQAVAAIAAGQEQHTRAAEAARVTAQGAALNAQQQAQEAVGRVQSAARTAEETIAAREAELQGLMDRLDDLAAETEALLGHADAAAIVDADGAEPGATLAPLPGSLADLVQRAGHAAQRIESAQQSLDALRARADSTRIALEQAVSVSSARADALSAALQELRPYRGLLAEPGATPGGPHDLPPAIRAVIERVRGEVAKDLSVIAAGLSEVAARAQKTSESLARP